MAVVGSVSSLITTKTGIGGLSSGMDIDALVLKMTSASRLKITKQEQSLQKLEWKQTAYRSVTTALNEFRNKYLSALSSTNFKGTALFNTIRASVGSDVKAFTATAQSNATAGKVYVNSIEKIATSQKITTGPISEPPTSTTLNVSSLADIAAGGDFTVTLDGVTRTVTFDARFKSDLQRIALTDVNNSNNLPPPTDAEIAAFDLSSINKNSDEGVGKMYDYLREALQNRVNELFENPPANGDYSSITYPKITVVIPSTSSTNNGPPISQGLRFDAAGGSTLTLGYATAPQPELSTIKRENYDTQKLYEAAVKAEEERAHKATGLGKLGFKDGDSNRIDIYSTELKNLNFFGRWILEEPTPTIGADGKSENNYIFYINNTRITVNEDESVYNLMTKINTSGAGVTLSYSEATDQFTLTAKTTGAGKNIDLDTTGDTNGNLLGALLGINRKQLPEIGSELTGNTTMTQGENAIAHIDGMKIERTSNEFTLNGVAFSLKETYNAGAYDSTNDPVTAGEAITLAHDSTDLVDTVKKFVEDYNAIVDLLYGLTNEEKFSDYEPLTEEQRAAMSESEVKLWEEKAKSGVLRGDSTVNKILNSMREAFLGTINGFGLYSMGITYGGWQENGKLKITDEALLKKTLNERPDQVRDFFTNTSKGVAVKLDKAIDDAVRTTGGQGHRGSLIEMAGLPASMSEKENAIYTQMLSHNTQINALKDRLEREESRLWAQFSAMESALSQLNAQNSMLSQYLGTGSSS